MQRINSFDADDEVAVIDDYPVSYSLVQEYLDDDELCENCIDSAIDEILENAGDTFPY